MDIPSAQAGRANSDRSAASTPGTDQGHGEDPPAVLSRRAAHELSNYWRRAGLGVRANATKVELDSWGWGVRPSNPTIIASRRDALYSDRSTSAVDCGGGSTSAGKPLGHAHA